MILESYTLLTRIPMYEGSNGLYTNALWEKDLSAHLCYINDFHIACPVDPISEARHPIKRVDGLKSAKVTRLRIDKGWASVILNLLPNFLLVRRAMRGKTIVHTSCAGWAFPLAYYTLLLRPFMRFNWINVVESSFWVKPASGSVSLRQHIEHGVHELMVGLCVRASDARIFTQDGYRQTYLGSHDAALVSTAVWIDDVNFRSDADLAGAQADADVLRLVFPARLVPEKGVGTLIAAIERWDELFGSNDGPLIVLDIIGDGSMADRCRAFVQARDHNARLKMRLLDPVPYGSAFFNLLRGYTAAVIANRQAEQSRVVFDVMAQGLPCLASDTTGNRSVVDDGATGVLFPIDDAAALAAIIERASHKLAWLHELGRKALSTTRGYSHLAMHQSREVFLRKTLQLVEPKVQTETSA